MAKKNKYIQWLSDVAAIRGWNVNDMINNKTYDYNLFYRLQPKEAKDMLNKNSDAHFTDIGKTVYHPTFSNESYYSGRRSIKNPIGIIGGSWNQDGSRYTLSKSQIDNNWNIRNTIDYLSVAEPNGVSVRMPNGNMPYVNGAYFDRVLPRIIVTPNKYIKNVNKYSRDFDMYKTRTYEKYLNGGRISLQDIDF